MTRVISRFGLSARALVTLASLIASPLALADAESSTRALHALFDSAWQRDLEENPTYATALGDRRYNDRWDDLSLAAIERSNSADARVLTDLSLEEAGVPVESLRKGA